MRRPDYIEFVEFEAVLSSITIDTEKNRIEPLSGFPTWCLPVIDFGPHPRSTLDEVEIEP